MTIENIKELLLDCYSKDLCYPKVQEAWTQENKCFGMCAITALIINDYFGGQIAKIKVDNISQYFNLINDEIIDLTKNQFSNEPNYTNYELISRESILAENTTKRYNLLRNKLLPKLLNSIDKQVYNCHKCPNLVEKFPNSPTVYLGKDTDVVLIGEAPANNGWRKSHML